MSPEELDDSDRSTGLPCDNVGRLFCWPCWDKLIGDKSYSFHFTGDAETCDSCGMIAQPLISQYPWKRRQD